jgi:hypothetical protein
MLSYLSGTRPSSLFEWNDPDEWMERLMFDLEISNQTWKILQNMRVGM